jgi:cytochrome c-type biogenesis protein CcmH
VTAFIIVSAAMLAAALLWLLVPLWRRAPQPEENTRSGESPKSGARRRVTLITALGIPLVAAGLYSQVSNWDWSASARVQEQAAQTEDMLRRLEERLQQTPQDEEGWLLLGRSYAALERYARAVDAYQHAYDLSKGENVEAAIGLAEALTLTDQASLGGRAGQLFEDALTKAPNHPKALWYTAIGALQAGDLRLGRDRLQQLLAQEPPEELRALLQRQIDDLSEQLGEGPATALTSAAGGDAAPTAERAIDVQITISPELQAQAGAQFDATTPLFVLARDPAAGGPPLAVQRHTAQALPLRVRLSERDAMIASRSIATVPRVAVVARLSRTGSPQAQSGDLYGEAEFEFGKDSGTLNIIIDRTVP